MATTSQEGTSKVDGPQKREAGTPVSDSNRRLLEQFKEHVVQIEALNVYGISFLGALSLTFAIVDRDSLKTYIGIIACAFLAGLPAVLRVTNPRSSVRNRLTWGASLGGLGAAVGTAGGALIDVAALGLTGGFFTAAGLALGAAVGAAAGDRIERSRNEDEMMERGKAFEYLFSFRHKNPKLSNPTQIEGILERMPKYDTNKDGHWRYSPDDLKQVVEDTLPVTLPSPPGVN